MLEITPVYPYRIELRCDKCGAKMEQTGITHPTNPPQYPHRCVNPDCQHTFSAEMPYPYIHYHKDPPAEVKNHIGFPDDI